MAAFDYEFVGTPVGGSSGPANAIDLATGILYYTSSKVVGWKPLAAHGVGSFTQVSPPAATAAGEVRIAGISNHLVVSENANVGGLYYPVEAYHQRINRIIIANGNTGGPAFTAENSNNTINSGANVASTATAPDQFSTATTASSGNVTKIEPSGNLVKTGKNIWWSGYGSPAQTATYRLFFGLSSTTGTTTASANNPTAQIAGFLATSDNANSTSTANYNVVISDGATVRSIDTGVAVVANVGHKFDIREDSATAKWYFYIDGVLVAGSPITLNAPTGALRQQMAMATLTTAAMTMNFAYCETWCDN